MKSKQSEGRGRPKLGKDAAQEVVASYLKQQGKVSIRALGRELKMAPATVKRILQEADALSETAESATKPAPSDKAVSSLKPSERVNLRTVAAHAGVSVYTASLALRESPRVAQQTRQRVEASAQELGYQRHPYVSAQLAAVRRGRVTQVNAAMAYLYDEFQPGASWTKALEKPYGPVRKFNAAVAAARKRGYELSPFVLRARDRSPKRLEKMLISRGIRGLLLDFRPQAIDQIDFDFGKFNCVAFYEQTEISPHVFSYNDFQDHMLMFCRLWELGYRRIGIAIADSYSAASVYRPDAGYRHCVQHLVPEALRLPVFYHESWADAIRRYLVHGETPPDRNRCEEHRWLMQQNWKPLLASLDPAAPDDKAIQLALLERWIKQARPEVIMCEQQRFIPWLEALGLRVPQDIALAHSNLNTDVEGWSGIRRADEIIAETAVEELSRNIELGYLGLPRHPLHVRMVGQWVDGKTTRKIRKPLIPMTQPAERFIRRVENRPVLD